MALPFGLTPKTVTLGIASFFDGTIASGRATITAPVNVLHVPSNRPIFGSDMTVPFVDGEAIFNLLPTDAPGLNRVDWSYKLKVEIQGATTQPEVIYFLLPTDGPDVVDLDGLVTVPSSAGTPISVEAVTVADLTSPTSDAGTALRTTFGGGVGIVGFGALPKWRAARARVQAGLGDAKILCVGDSTTAGVGVDSANPGWQGSPLSYPYQLAAMLNSAGLSSARGLGIPPPGINGNWDGRWAGAGWGNAALGWGNQAAWQGDSGASPMVYTDPVLADRYDVYYLTSNTAGTFTVQATGGAVSTVNAVTDRGVAKVTVSAGSAATTNTVTITPTLGTTFIVGVEPWLSTSRRIRVGNAGRGGATTLDWAADPFGSHEFSSATCIETYAPDLTVISLGINDSGNNTATADVLVALNTLITSAQKSGDVALLLPVPSTEAAVWGRHVPEYAVAQRALGLPYVDTALTLGSGDAAAARGRMWDGLHPNAGGYTDLAQPLARGLLAA